MATTVTAKETTQVSLNDVLGLVQNHGKELVYVRARAGACGVVWRGTILSGCAATRPVARCTQHTRALLTPS